MWSSCFVVKHKKFALEYLFYCWGRGGGSVAWYCIPQVILLMKLKLLMVLKGIGRGEKSERFILLIWSSIKFEGQFRWMVLRKWYHCRLGLFKCSKKFILKKIHKLYQHLRITLNPFHAFECNQALYLFHVDLCQLVVKNHESIPFKRNSAYKIPVKRNSLHANWKTAWVSCIYP